MDNNNNNNNNNGLDAGAFNSLLNNTQSAENSNNQVTGQNVTRNQGAVNPNVQPAGQNVASNQGVEKPPKKKKNLKIIIFGAIIAFILLIIFVIFPYIRDNVINNPEHVFKSSIDNLFTTVGSNIEKYSTKNRVLEVDTTLDSNAENFKAYNDYTYNFKYGSDSDNMLSEIKLSLNDKDEEKYSFAAYVKDYKLYEEFSTFDKLIDLGRYDELSYKALLDTFQNYDGEDIKYLMDITSSVLKESLNKDRFVKGSKTIEINGKKIGVSKNSYKLDSKEIQRLIKCVLNGIYKDEKAVDIITKSYDIKKSEFKEMIDNLDKQYSDNNDEQNSGYPKDKNDSFLFNIYMNGFDFAGVDIEGGNGNSLSYYTDKSNFNIQLSDFSIVGVKKKKYTDVEMKTLGQTYMTLKVRSFQTGNIDLDYNIQTISGSLKYKETSPMNGNFTLSIKEGSDYLNVESNFRSNKSSMIANIDESKAVTLSDEEFEKVVNDFMESFKDTPLNIYDFYTMLFSISQFDSSDSSALDSAYQVVDAVRLAYQTDQFEKNPTTSNPIVVNFSGPNKGVFGDNGIEISITGSLPDSGKVFLYQKSTDEYSVGTIRVENLKFGNHVCNSIKDSDEIVCN